MLRYAIPRFRLPRKIIDEEIRQIFSLGIDFKPNTILGRDVGLEQLKSDGYDAVFLALGAPLSRRIPLEGCDVPDVLGGIEFLKQVAAGQEIRLRDDVVVIGGGNLAIDAALAALRCGAQKVSVVCLESMTEMAAGKEEIERALAQGVNLLPSWSPDKLWSNAGRITALDLVECACAFDDKGNICPHFGESKKCIPVDQIILAVGQATELSFLNKNSPIATDGDLIVVNRESLETAMPGVYAGGDVVRMPGTVVHAIAAGRKAAASIDRALGGNGDIEEVLFQRAAPDRGFGKDLSFASRPREAVPELEVEDRLRGFAEVSLGYKNEQAVKEARRCLQCDVRLQLGCNPSPPRPWLAFNRETINQIPQDEGVYQLLDEAHNVLAIKGAANLRQELLEQLEENEKASFFEFEEAKRYSQRESELIQRYLHQHGTMPGGDQDDLY
jgi:NADPH-dependent glutamate synthase beta subunit-like oxidoreductase